jgi:hypothetical protein
VEEGDLALCSVGGERNRRRLTVNALDDSILFFLRCNCDHDGE